MTEMPAVGQKSLVGEVWDLLDAESDLSDAAKYVVLAALNSDVELRNQLDGDGTAHEKPDADETPDEPAGAFLREIEVSGFRGIGPKATLQITPYPGITVVSGRNGSGKSSFAEALEYALTGESYRWRNKARLWADSWRNLHQGSPCEVKVEFTVEDGPSTTIGAQWADDADLDGAKRWSQRVGERRQIGVDALGWSTAVEVHRPILSYDEIGGLLEQEPSKLYDALNRLLALDEILDAESRLAAEYSERGRQRKDANAARTALKKVVKGVSDTSVEALSKLLAPNKYDLDTIAAMASGTSGTQKAVTDALRAIVDLELPDDDAAAAAALRESLVTMRALADATVALVEQRTDILTAAMGFRSGSGGGDVTCPVCEQGVLSDEWERHTREVITDQNEQLGLYREAQQSVRAKEQAARAVALNLPVISPVDGVELESMTTYRTARDAAVDLPAAAEDVPSHIESRVPAALEALGALQVEAETALAERESVWTPIAQQTMEWVALERKARESDTTVALLAEAKKWLSDNTQKLREQRLEPIEEGARSIWAQLRQESDVELSKISLEGSRTRRKAVLQGLVDGKEAGALSVMSQGELHALALALFLPRATASSSPFRFIVLDDPIQAMDPAKIDGFLNVLTDLAKSRQIIVFSHDDRLATAIRQQSIDAHLIEVSRESGSTLVVRPAEDPARRYVEDAFAMVADENVPDDVKRRAAPALFRFAIESAARQRYFTRRNVEGKSQQESEASWESASTVAQHVALTLHDDPKADVSGWRSYRQYRGPALTIANKGVHHGMTVTKEDIDNLRTTVADLLEGK